MSSPSRFYGRNKACFLRKFVRFSNEGVQFRGEFPFNRSREYKARSPAVSVCTRVTIKYYDVVWGATAEGVQGHHDKEGKRRETNRTCEAFLHKRTKSVVPGFFFISQGLIYPEVKVSR